MSQAKQGSFRKTKGTLATYLSLNITVTPKLGFICAVLAFKERESDRKRRAREGPVLYKQNGVLSSQTCIVSRNETQQ